MVIPLKAPLVKQILKFLQLLRARARLISDVGLSLFVYHI